MRWCFSFLTKEKTESKNVQLHFRIIANLILIYRYLRYLRLTCVWMSFCSALPLSKMKRMQTELEKHRHTGIQKNQNITTDRQRCGIGVRGGGAVRTYK